MPSFSVTVNDQPFNFVYTDPYAEGHVCSAAEATLLNATYGQILRKKWQRRLEGRGEKNPQMWEELNIAQHFADFTKDFSLEDSGARLDPVARMAQKLAKAQVHEYLTKQGKKAEDFPDGRLDAMVAKVARLESIVAEAKRRVEVTQTLAADSLDRIMQEAG